MNSVNRNETSSLIPACLHEDTEYLDSAYLRWMNIWLDAHKRGLTGSDKDVLVLGPGKWESEKKVQCPQMAEAFKLWSGSRFTVLDSNQSVLDSVSSIDHQLEVALIANTFKINAIKTDVFEPGFSEIKQKLTSEEQPEYKLNMKKFKITSDILPEEYRADVILATFSLIYPLRDIGRTGHDEKAEQRIKILEHYITKLRPGGVMYIDYDCLSVIFGQSEELKDTKNLQNVITNIGIQTLKQKIAKSVDFDIDLVHLPQIMGIETRKGHYFIDQPSSDDNWCFAMAADAYAIVRKSPESLNKKP
jgi:hypothetical protein